MNQNRWGTWRQNKNRQRHNYYNNRRKMLEWLGHLRRNGHNRWIKIITECSPFRRNKKGGPRRLWRNKVDQAMESSGLENVNWHDSKSLSFRLRKGRECQLQISLTDIEIIFWGHVERDRHHGKADCERQHLRKKTK